jgi:hypothetical protein
MKHKVSGYMDQIRAGGVAEAAIHPDQPDVFVAVHRGGLSFVDVSTMQELFTLAISDIYKWGYTQDCLALAVYHRDDRRLRQHIYQSKTPEIKPKVMCDRIMAQVDELATQQPKDIAGVRRASTVAPSLKPAGAKSS